jgi:hypothetical protein
VHERKNEAMRELLRSAGWQWAGWMLLGSCSCRPAAARRRPMMGRRGLARAVGRGGLALPRAVAVRGAQLRDRAPRRRAVERAGCRSCSALLGVALLLFIRAALRPAPPAAPPQAMSSRIGYPASCS